ncbi:hypothetical protein AOLI_G00073190 [Acnodon oligacanthus]
MTLRLDDPPNLIQPAGKRLNEDINQLRSEKPAEPQTHHHVTTKRGLETRSGVGAKLGVRDGRQGICGVSPQSNPSALARLCPNSAPLTVLGYCSDSIRVINGAA